MPIFSYDEGRGDDDSQVATFEKEDGNGQDSTFHIKWGQGAIYRLGLSDIHGCNHCQQRGDIHFMRVHECNGKK